MMEQNERLEVESKIAALIADRLVSGSKLPTEKEMAKEFGVSRTVLREVLSVFEASGILKSLQGSGRYAQMPELGAHFTDTWSILIRANPYRMLELVEIRGILEISSLPRALERITVTQLQAMGRLVGIMKEKAEREEGFEEEDRAFHRILYESTGNLLLEQLLTAFNRLYVASRIDFKHSEMPLVAVQHEQILQAVIQRDLPLLTKLMSEQFVEVRGRMLVSLMKAEQEGKLKPENVSRL